MQGRRVRLAMVNVRASEHQVRVNSEPGRPRPWVQRSSPTSEAESSPTPSEPDKMYRLNRGVLAFLNVTEWLLTPSVTGCTDYSRSAVDWPGSGTTGLA